MEKYKAYRVAIKLPGREHWFFTWKTECETFDLDRYVMNCEMFTDFDPFKPETNAVFVLWEYDIVMCDYDDVHEYGKMVAKTDFYLVWTKWMESVKEVF